MPWHERDIVAKWPELRCNRLDERWQVSARKVGAPDRTFEQYVADERQPMSFVKEYNVTRRVPGAMANLHPDVTETDFIAAYEIAIRYKTFHYPETETPSLLRELVDPELVLDVRSFDGYLETFSEFSGCAAVIDMTVGKQNLIQLCARFVDGADQRLKVASRIDQRRLAALLADQ